MENEKSRVPTILIAGLLIIGVGVGGYFLGNSAADADGKEKEGYADGAAALRAQYQEGKRGYELIFNAGKAAGTRQGTASGEAAGKKVGFEKGEVTGKVQGEAQGVTNGANAALGGLTWQNGTYYIVNGGPGSSGITYAITQRKEMSPAERYSICADNPADICTEPNQ